MKNSNIEAVPSQPIEIFPLLTAEDVAAILQVSVGLVYNLMKRGRLECVEIGRCKRIFLTDLENFLTAISGQEVKLVKFKGIWRWINL